MTDGPKFAPVLPAHAIERCGITIIFNQPLPEKLFRKFRADATIILKKIGLVAIERQGLSITFDAETGKISPSTDDMFSPMQFASADGASQLVFAPNSLVWHTSRYIRWEPFIGQFETITGTIISKFLEIVSISSISIEYWDRFLWSGGWENIDYSKILRSSNASVAMPPLPPLREWHSHAGWFEKPDGLRRLINLNVDVVDFGMPNGSTVPSVGIYTLLRDEMNAPGFANVDVAIQDYAYVQSRLDSLHKASKNVLADTISDDMKDRIALFPSDPQ